MCHSLPKCSCLVTFVCTVLFHTILSFVFCFLSLVLWPTVSYDNIKAQLSVFFFFSPHSSQHLFHHLVFHCSHLPGLLPHTLPGNPAHDSGGGRGAAHWAYDPGMVFNEAVEMFRAWVTCLPSVNGCLIPSNSCCEIEKKNWKLDNTQLFTLRLEVFLVLAFSYSVGQVRALTHVYCLD